MDLPIVRKCRIILTCINRCDSSIGEESVSETLEFVSIEARKRGHCLGRFFRDIKKYRHYAVYAAKSELKSEVANSRLSCLWWVLEPICFMLVYTFMVQIVFRSSEPYMPVFVFVGLTLWNFFNKSILQSVKLVSSNRSIVSKVYLPKFILVLVKMGVLAFKMGISILLTFALMAIYQVPVTWNILYLLPILLILFLVTFGMATIIMHFGVFVEDLSNVCNIVLRLVFYLSGVFYSLSTRLPKEYSKIVLRANPIAFLIDQCRQVMIFESHPSFLYLGAWLLIGIILSFIGVRTVYKYENSYVKVM